MKVIVYSRVSTTGQAEDGVSLEAQVAKARAWCLVNDAEVVAVYSDEGISGTLGEDDRPGLKAALEHSCREKCVILVYSLSRLARSTKLTIELGERLSKAGAELVSLSEKIDTTTAAGKMVFRMLAVMAEFERDMTAERTKMALAHLKSKGEAYGQVPIGKKREGDKLVEDVREQAAISRARALRGEGLPLRTIADLLAKESFVNRNGKPYSPSVVSSMAAA